MTRRRFKFGYHDVLCDEFYDPDGLRSPDAKWVNPNQTKTKCEAPYSYSEFFIFGCRNDIKPKNVRANYSDRLQEWDSKAFSKACIKKRFEHYSRQELTDFINKYYSACSFNKEPHKKYEAVALVEGCNVGNGYPYWVFFYREVK